MTVALTLHVSSALIFLCLRISSAVRKLHQEGRGDASACAGRRCNPKIALAGTFLVASRTHGGHSISQRAPPHRGRAALNSLVGSPRDATFDFTSTAKLWNDTLPTILSNEASIDAFPKNFTIVDLTGATRVLLARNLTASKKLVRRLRRLIRALGMRDSIRMSYLGGKNGRREETAGVEPMATRWRIKLNSSKPRSLILDSEVLLHIHGLHACEIRIEKCLLDGQSFQLWPEIASERLQADIPQIFTREPSWRQFASDFTVVDGRRVVNGQRPNKALLGVLRNFYRQSSLLPLKREFRVGTKKSFFVNSSGSVVPALIARWKLTAQPEPGITILRTLRNTLPAVEGKAAFLFNAAGEIQSLQLDQNFEQLVNNALFEIKYFAYGSNLNADVLAGRTGGRTVVQTLPQPGVLENYSLVFNLGQALFGAAASVEPSPGQACHGLVYTLDLQQFLAMLASEGVPFAYSVESVDVAPYVPGGAVHNSARKPMQAYTLRSGRGLTSLPPSKRYKNLLVKGARANGLDASWISWLESLETSIF